MRVGEIMRMKLKDPEKLKKARNIINLLLEGIDPVTFEKIEDKSFINDPKIIRIFSYISLVLNQDIIDAEDNEENDVVQSDLYHQRSDISTLNYKEINDTIKSAKISRFNKVQNKESLKKLAEYMEKEN